MKEFLAKIFGRTVLESTTGLLNAVDSIVTSDEERLTLKKEIEAQSSNLVVRLSGMQMSTLIADQQGSWFQRNWRPLVMLGLFVVVVYSLFIAPAFGLPNTELDSALLEMLGVGVAGYVAAPGLVANGSVKFLSNLIRKKK